MCSQVASQTCILVASQTCELVQTSELQRGNPGCRFNMEEMLDLKGNTAVYLLYAHARIASIVRKAGRNMPALIETGQIQLEHERELALGLHLVRHGLWGWTGLDDLGIALRRDGVRRVFEMYYIKESASFVLKKG
jgi:hypothetical protein